MHRTPHRVEEGSAGVFHEMPAVSDLHGIREAFGCGLFVTSATIPCDDGDRWVVSQPRGHRRRLTIWQNVDDPSPLEITDNRPVSMTTLPGPVIDTDDTGCLGRRCRLASDNTKESVLTHREEEASCKALPRSTAQREAEMMNQSLQPRRAPREWPGDSDVKPFNENTLSAIHQKTTEAASLNLDTDQLSL
jgi:hypothetical protein